MKGQISEQDVSAWRGATEPGVELGESASIWEEEVENEDIGLTISAEASNYGRNYDILEILGKV